MDRCPCASTVVDVLREGFYSDHVPVSFVLFAPTNKYKPQGSIIPDWLASHPKFVSNASILAAERLQALDSMLHCPGDAIQQIVELKELLHAAARATRRQLAHGPPGGPREAAHRVISIFPNLEAR